jgi:peroxiredoxin
MPAMEKLHQELQKDGLVVLAVNFQEGPGRVREFMAQHKLTFTAPLDADGKVAESFQAWALPVTVIINKRGEIAAKAMGAREWHGPDAIQYFRKLLAAES